MPYYPYNGYYPQMPMPDQLAQLRQGYPQMPMQSVQPPIQRGQDAAIIWVANKQEADNYMVAPNSAVALWDRSAPVIYLKQADASGKPSMTIYDLVERKNAPVQAPQAQIGGICHAGRFGSYGSTCGSDGGACGRNVCA